MHCINILEQKEINCAMILLRRCQENKKLNQIKTDDDMAGDANSGVSNTSGYKGIICISCITAKGYWYA